MELSTARRPTATLTTRKQIRVIPRFFQVGLEKKHEAHLPALSHPAQAPARLPSTDAQPSRPSGDQRPPRQGAQPTGCLRSKAAGLPRHARLNAAADYTGRFRHRLQGRWYQVLARPNRLPIARLGLIASRRAAARAVDRSLAKRLAREEFRRTQAIIRGWDVVVRLMTVVGRPDRIAARNELRELFVRLQA